MWWYSCPAAPWMFFAPIMPMVFILGCIAVMVLMMRRHRQLSGPGGNAPYFFDTCFGPWRSVANQDVPSRQTNLAFEEYRQQALQRLEREQAEFKNFLEQLRLAKDRAEFDEFMKQRQSAASGAA